MTKVSTSPAIGRNDSLGELPYHGENPAFHAAGPSHLVCNLSDLRVYVVKEPAEVAHDTGNQQALEPFRDCVEDYLHGVSLSFS